MNNLDHLTASNDDVLSWCHRWKDAVLTDGSGRDRLLCATSNILVKINDAVVVKFGPSVTQSEAANQTYAYVEFAPIRSQISVPQVYRYFEHEGTDGRIGYIMMEYICGKLVADVSTHEFQNCIARVAMAVQTMWQITSDKPGPIEGGEPRGTVWAPDLRAYECFADKKELERWFDRAIRTGDTRMDLTAMPLAFCHLDLAARNVIQGEDGVVYLLDWAFAGFYPRTFEIWVLRSSAHQESEFPKALLSALPSLSEDEEQLYDLIWQAYRQNMLHNSSIKLRNT